MSKNYVSFWGENGLLLTILSIVSEITRRPNTEWSICMCVCMHVFWVLMKDVAIEALPNLVWLELFEEAYFCMNITWEDISNLVHIPP